ncbi:MAG: TIGR02453 family protein [Phycisphaerae bacterium]|jgi:uncharacterized protein (TIGR02453 family)
MSFQGFDESLVRFLGQLKRHNNRSWFQRNKTRYEAEVREPTLAFIRAIAPKIEAVSPHIFVSDSKVGGSMMRPYRDTRFTGSKLPYKTNVGIHFRHERGLDAHAPGFWMHIEPGEFWLAVGLWKPDGSTLQKIRQCLVESPRPWLAARDDAGFQAVWQIIGDSLKRPPRGFDPGHPLIEDIKRTEFLGLCDLGIKELYRPDVVGRVAACYAASTPFMKFLCNALGLKF